LELGFEERRGDFYSFCRPKKRQYILQKRENDITEVQSVAMLEHSLPIVSALLMREWRRRLQSEIPRVQQIITTKYLNDQHIWLQHKKFETHSQHRKEGRVSNSLKMSLKSQTDIVDPVDGLEALELRINSTANECSLLLR
jgi:hypothetical protein